MLRNRLHYWLFLAVRAVQKYFERQRQERIRLLTLQRNRVFRMWIRAVRSTIDGASWEEADRLKEQYELLDMQISLA